MNWLDDLLRLREHKEPFVLATVIDSMGSSPREAGAKMAITAAETFGTVGGGVLEAAVVERSRSLLGIGGSEIFEFAYPQSGCGGSVKVFLESLIPQKTLWIFGGGHVGYALASVMVHTPFAVHVVEERIQTLQRHEWPEGVKIVKMAFTEAALAVEDDAYCVVAGFSSHEDRKILSALAGVKWRYLGVLGSRNKGEQLREHLQGLGISQEQMNRFFSPAGIGGIGGKSPGEIAISIAAQILTQ